MNKITPCLWFDGQAEEAANFYTSVFTTSRIDKIAYYGEAGPGVKGSVMSVTCLLNGQDFMLLNGGPEYKFTEAISLMVYCKDQAEVDYYWEKLSDGGEKGVCGWLKDKFGVSWQVVPEVMVQFLSNRDTRKSESVMRAMLQMKKLDIAQLKAAFDKA